MKKKPWTWGNVFVFLFFLFFIPLVSGEVDVILTKPENGAVFTNTTLIEFNCSASGDSIVNLTLYHNLSGKWEANQTMVFGEFVWDSDSLLLCHFNGNTQCIANGSGAATSNTTVSFEDGVFFQSVFVNNSDSLRYATTNNFDKNQGTIEFWVKTTYSIVAGSQEDRWFFSIGGEYVANSFEIYVASDHLVFKIKDFNENDHWVESNILNWQPGEWHHVAAVWDLDGDVGNGEKMELYIDGVADNSNYDSTGENIYVENIASNMFIGSCDVNGCGASYVADASFEELRISKVVKTQSEINESYQKGLENRSWVFAVWNVSAPGDGYYVWNCLAYDNDSENNWSSANFSFSVDVSPPKFNDIYHTPNSTDDVDPGTEINVTVNLTDFSGVDTVILEWKETVWHNVTMFNIGGDLWRGNFTIDITGGNYSYRIWTNDTHGIFNISQIINLTAEWDYTWNATPWNFGRVSGKINSIGNLGVLRIINTGDDVLEFTLTHTWPLNVYFNGSANSLSFYLQNKSEVDINITIQFAGFDSESSMIINITASHGSQTPNPVYREIQALINSYSGGPYLDVNIVSLPDTVYQSQILNISAKVKNIGNETANETWLNWSLPKGWVNISGNITSYIGNLSPGYQAWNNLTIRLSPETASAGIVVIYVNSSCNGSSDSDSKTVGVGCTSGDGVCGAGCSYSNDNDCTIPTGGTTTVTQEIRVSSSVTKEKQRYGISLITPERVDMYRGEEKSFFVWVNNTEDGSIVDGWIWIKGYPQTHVKVFPLSFLVKYGSPKKIEIRIFAPNYTSYGEYKLKVLVKGKGKTLEGEEGEEVKDSKEILLVIHGVEENETIKILEKAKNEIQQLKEKGFDVFILEKMLKQANESLKKWEYDHAMELGRKILETKESMIRAYQVIKELEEKIKEARNSGIKLNESLIMYELAKAAFERGDYTRAEERGNNGLLAYVIETSSPSLWRFLSRHWIILVMSMIMMVPSSWIIRRRIYVAWIKKRLKTLGIEEREVKKLMKKLQKEHFERKAITKSEYHRAMYSYEKRLADIQRLKARLSSKLTGFLGPQRILEGLKKEEERIKEMMKDTQMKYFQLGSISRRSYIETMHVLEEELLEIRKEIKNLISEMGERGWKYRIKESRILVVAGIIFLVIFQSVNAEVILGTRESSYQAIQEAEKWIEEMVSLGFGVSYANDTLQEAKIEYEKGNYLAAETLAKYVKTIKESAIRVNKLIDEVEKKIYQAQKMGINVSYGKRLFLSGIGEFQNERYVVAEDFLRKALNEIETREAEFYMKRLSERKWDWMKFVKRNWFLILIAGSGIVIFSFVGYRWIKIKKIVKKLRKLEREKENLKTLIKEAQLAYFRDKTISKSEYEHTIKSYQERLVRIKKDIPVLCKVLEGLKFRRRIS